MFFDVIFGLGYLLPDLFVPSVFIRLHEQRRNCHFFKNGVVRNAPVKPLSGPTVEQENVSEYGGGW